MNLSKLDRNVLEAVRQSLGCETDDTSMDKEIAALGPKAVFQRFLQWEGIIGYSDIIWVAIANIQAAADEEKGGNDLIG